tara:strand:+ start:1470 stop:1652 length:183 start_codon:yes stop_codon:yes gene_type:complete
MIDKTTDSYKKSEDQIKTMLVTMVNKKRENKGLDPLPFPKEPKAKDFVKKATQVKRIPKQ